LIGSSPLYGGDFYFIPASRSGYRIKTGFGILAGMKRSSLLLLSICFCYLSDGQSPSALGERYYIFISKASECRIKKEYHSAGLAYDSAFSAAGGHGRPGDLYNAACSWALAGYPDPAFTDLYLAVRQGKWAQPEVAMKDADLTSLVTDKRWPDMLDRMKANQLENEHRFDKALQDTLNRIYTRDQSGRQAIDSISKRYGGDSPQMDSLWEDMSAKDSADLVRVEEILARREWPSPDEVGERASTAVFLVIQHSDSMVHARYLPRMRAAVQRGDAQPEHLALLEDRLLTEQGKPQLYGSQVRTDDKGKSAFFPIADEPNVDKRRAAVGLEPLEEYARYFGMDYHLPAAAPAPR
jgi:hypothetical protein